VIFSIICRNILHPVRPIQKQIDGRLVIVFIHTGQQITQLDKQTIKTIYYLSQIPSQLYFHLSKQTPLNWGRQDNINIPHIIHSHDLTRFLYSQNAYINITHQLIIYDTISKPSINTFISILIKHISIQDGPGMGLTINIIFIHIA
jgi:hypothetical protein